MKAFMTVCAVLAAGANSVNLRPAFTPTYPHGSLRPSLMSPYSLGPFNGPVMSIQPYSTYGPDLMAPPPMSVPVIPGGYLIKREAESPYHIKTKVVNAKTGTDQETEVKVDPQGNGFSYQHIQQEDVLQRNMDINQQQMMNQYRSMAQIPVTSNTYNGGMRSSLNDVMMRDQNMMSGMDERDMMYNNMLGYRVNTYQDDSCKDAHEVCTNLTSFCNNAGIATMCKSACGLCTPTTGRSFQQIDDRDMFNVNQAMNVDGMKIDELMALGDTMRSMKNKMMPKMALWYSPTMRNNYNMPSQMDMVDDRDIYSRQQAMNQMTMAKKSQQLNADRMLFKREAADSPAFTYNVIAEHPVSDATRDIYRQFYNLPSSTPVYYMRVNQMHPDGGVSYVHRPVNTLMMPRPPMVYSIYNTLNTVRGAVAPTSKVEVVRKGQTYGYHTMA